jgi:hypothetical protein
MLTDGGMASKGLRAIFCQITRKVGAGYNPPHTTETLIGYTACWRVVVFVFLLSILLFLLIEYLDLS